MSKNKIYNKHEFPKLSSNGLSEDVIAYNEYGSISVCFYDYDERCWKDSSWEDYGGFNFVWMYKPEYLKL